MSTIKFSDLKFEPQSELGISFGIQARIFFDNGYGASIVKGRYTYGGKDGLYELAVLKGNQNKNNFTYKTPITDDVLGYLTENDVLKHLEEIKNLSK